ncbi:hypothetical protein CISG_00576 [Coccidioides immitis RMSCC 3703]|uniref:SH3 domain-containing protein n=1 Tax=Coccidioides immitis RMSCC 3703 TaxID=454286 RepID=A0A0J8QQB6_COCIT|nr:hypothetical protein CISG_00576 [Coccidioides immitis RMSCC 3703]
MAPEAPQLPTKFPCWCRAIYSWGGETKRDLGFVEGDLIECLNAGDGSWWTGRLKRDRRMVGVFPSNFVKVLDEGFVPLSRSVSPLPLSAQVTPSNSTAGGPKKQKTVFRKPFQGYKEVVGPSGTLSKQSTPVESPLKTPVAQKQSMRKSRDPDRTPTTRRNEAPARPPSRAISPAPPPPPVAEPNDSPPPPPPPPHRILHRRSVSPQPQYYHQMQDNYPPRTPSPYPQSPIHGNTPSPLRDAIEDVMTSLHDMGLHRGDPSPEPPRGRSPFQPWSPDAYEQIHEHSAQGHAERPLTSLGLGGHDPFREHDFDYQQNSFNRYYDGPPQLGNYVERMESRLRQLHAQENKDELHLPPPSPPKKDSRGNEGFMSQRQRSLRNRKSISELNSAYLGRTHTTRSTTTNSSSGVQSVATNSTTSTGLTSQSLMSGTSAGGFSATSAASFARRSKVYGMSKDRPASPLNRPLSRGIYGLERGKSSSSRPQTPLTGISYHPSHDSRQGATSAMGWSEYSKGNDSPGLLGGLTTPKTKKTGFLKKILESAKTGAATARSNIASGQISRPSSPTKNLIQGGISSLSPTRHGKDASKEMGIGANDWVQVRRDVNRATTPSRNELIERAERCQMMEYPVIAPVTDLHEIGEGDEGIDGLPIAEPTNWNTVNLQLVDKSARFITSLPPMMNPVSLAQGYVCRPYRSDAQRLRAIFTWVGEKIAWDDDLDCDVDLRRVILMKRGCPHEVAVLVMEMCAAVGIHAEVVYAGKKGLMHSSKDIPHPLAFALPIIHTGENPPYDFILRHPTPHAQRHDLYVIQPQCVRLAINNTFVFAVRQHPAYSPSTTSSFSEVSGRVSPNPFARPSSSLSMVSSIATASNASTTSASSKSHVSREKPAKLAVQTPSGKILRLSRKADHMITTSTATEWANDGTPDGSVWETVIKVSERGVWRGLVLADRSARWCVWGEWECV